MVLNRYLSACKGQKKRYSAPLTRTFPGFEVRFWRSLAMTGFIAYYAPELIDFEMEQVPKWLSPKEKHHHPNAACAVAMIR